MLKASLITVLLALLVTSACGGDSGPRVRLLLQPVEGMLIEDMDTVLDGAVSIIETRLDGYDIGSEVERLGEDTIAVLVSVANAEEAQRVLATTGFLQFCVPVTDEDGNVAVLRTGRVRNQTRTCEPARDVAGDIIVDAGVDRGGNAVPAGEIEFVPWLRLGAPGSADNPRDEEIVWKPAAALIEGVELTLDGRYLRPNTSVTMLGRVISQPTLLFEFEGDGEELLELITERLARRNYPIAAFLDGMAIRDTNGLMIAPQVQAPLTGGAGTITGLSLETAEELSILLNTGALPLPLRIIEISEVPD